MTPYRFIVAFVLLLVTNFARADFDSAAEAYRAQDYPDAYKQFMALARAGDARAQTVIAMMNKFGEAVPKDSHNAFEWYKKAADQGYGPALFNVGLMYAEGNGVARDEDAALKWLKKAAAAGFSRANDKLAELGARRVAQTKTVDESEPWSKSWNFRLPNDIRDEATDNALPPPDTTWRVQLGAMGTQAGAHRLWDALAAQAPELFQNMDPIIRLADGVQPRVYRVQTGPFDNLKAALGFCRELQNHISTGCMPLRQ